MGSVKLERGKLKDITDRYYYGACCSACRHSARLSIRRLQDYLGGEFPLAKIRPRLRCEKCGSRHCVVTFLAPESLSGSLVHLRTHAPR